MKETSKLTRIKQTFFQDKFLWIAILKILHMMHFREWVIALFHDVNFVNLIKTHKNRENVSREK